VYRIVRHLINVCPLCRVYDPTWLGHMTDCPFWRGRAGVTVVSFVWARYCNNPVVIVGYSKEKR